MPIALGTLDVPKISLGDTAIAKVSLGDVLVWPAGVSGGVDLGTETLTANDSDHLDRIVTARVTYKSDKTTALTATATAGGSSSTSSPALNWCPVGNNSIDTWISYELNAGSSVLNSGVLTVCGGIPESTEFGEHRAQHGTLGYVIDSYAIYNGTYPSGGSVDTTVTLSTWDAASGGNRLSFGNYVISIAV